MIAREKGIKPLADYLSVKNLMVRRSKHSLRLL
jgi:hypothetical protein